MIEEKTYVIGGGISGLTVAIYLKINGQNQVTIIEKNDTLGGRLYEFKDKGYTFSAGPSWLWMIDWINMVFKDLDIPNNQMSDLIKLDPQYKMVYEDDELSIPGNYSDIKKMCSEKFKCNKLDKLNNEMKKNYFKTRDILSKNNNLSITEYTNLPTIKFLLSCNLFTSYRKYFQSFTSDQNLQSMLEWPSMFISSSPNKISAAYSLLTYTMMSDGTYIPKKGMYEIVEILKKKAIDLGIEIKLNESLQSYEIEKNKITKLKTDKNIYNVKNIIATCDYNFNESILPCEYRTYPSKYWESLETTPSCLLIHLGLKKKIPEKNFHVLFFDNNIDHHIDSIYNKKNPGLPAKPLFYLNITSKILNTAPKNGETLFILVPIPPQESNMNEDEIEKCYTYILNRLENYYNTNIKDYIEVKKIFRDIDFKDRFNSYKGNAYGLTCHPLQTAFIKPRIKSRYIHNLYYSGQFTNPGGGIPPCLVSGAVTAKYVIQNNDLSNRFNLGESITLISSVFIRTQSFITAIIVFFKEIINIFSKIFSETFFNKLIKLFY